MLALNRPRISFRNTLVIGIAIPFINACGSTGGECRYQDNERLGKVAGIKDDGSVIIETPQSLGESQFYAAKSAFSDTPKKGDILDVTIRHHSSGGCSPASILQVKQRPDLTKTFVIEPKHAYAAAFKLSEMQGCTYRQIHQLLGLTADSTAVPIEEQAACAPHVTFIDTLNEAQKKQLLNLNAKSFDRCSLATITNLQQNSINDNKPETSMIGCASYEKKRGPAGEKNNAEGYDTAGLESAIAFTFETNNEGRINVRLLNIY